MIVAADEVRMWG